MECTPATHGLHHHRQFGRRRETLRQRLPEDEYQFVELVSVVVGIGSLACQQGVRCDLLVISGHFDSGTEFYRRL
jgi:hypothetical protein